jgi:hypothetical protein
MVFGQVTEIIRGHLLSATANDVRAERLPELTELNKEIEKVKEPFLKEIEKATEPLQRRVCKIQEEIDLEIEKRTAEVLERTTFPTGSEVVEKIKTWLERWDRSHWRKCGLYRRDSQGGRPGALGHPSAHAAALMRVRSGQQGNRYPHHSRLSRP